MRGPLAVSLCLHVLAGLAMFWASQPGRMLKAPLPSATVVKLIKPMSLPPAGKITGAASTSIESAPPLKIPDAKKGKAKKPVETTKPAEKKEAPKSTTPSPGKGGKELVGNAGTLHVGGNGDFEYDFYLAVVQSKIEQNFRPPPGLRGQTMATVAFTIEQNGQISTIQLAKSSGKLLIDQAAERAVRAAGRFPPLPPQYDKGKLDIYFEFLVNPSSTQ
jgi:periplasmic protein TonB